MADIPAIILIEDLPPTAIPTLSHFIAAMKDGQSVKLSLEQVLALIATASISASDIDFAPSAGIVATNVQGAIQEVVSDQASLLAGKFTIADGTLILAQAGVEAVQRTWTAAMLRGSVLAAGGTLDALLEDQKPSGTDGSAGITSGIWNIRTLNTKVFDSFGFVTLSGNVFTPSVASRCWWRAPAYGGSNHKTRLYDITAGAVAAWGSNALSDTGPTAHTDSSGIGTLVAGHDYRLEHCLHSNSNPGFGVATGFAGVVELYAQVGIWRI